MKKFRVVSIVAVMSSVAVVTALTVLVMFNNAGLTIDAQGGGPPTGTTMFIPLMGCLMII